MRQVKTADLARGRWPSILSQLGVEAKFLRNVHGPCPMCGGTKPFRFDDKGQRGTFICNHCGSGDGVMLVERFLGCDKREALRRVDEIIGAGQTMVDPASPEVSPEQKVAWARQVWASGVSITKGDPVDLYLTHRGIGEPHAAYPASIRFVPACPYGKGVSHPAMVSLITAPDRSIVGVHRTYLTADGRKIEGVSRKVLGSLPEGAAVRTCAPQEVLGIAEGIETALSASALYQMPVWAALNSGALEKWTPPAECREVAIFGDHDDSFTGQAAAYALAKRLSRLGIRVSVILPAGPGDWNDEQMRRLA